MRVASSGPILTVPRCQLDPKTRARRSAAVRKTIKCLSPAHIQYVFPLHISAQPTSTSGLARIFFRLPGGSIIAIFFRGETCRDCLAWKYRRATIKASKKEIPRSFRLTQLGCNGIITVDLPQVSKKTVDQISAFSHSSFFLPILWLD